MPPRKRKTAKENVKSMFINLNAVLDQVKRDKGIPREVLVDAVESAMVSAARRKYGHEAELEAQYNEEAGEVELFHFKTVIADDADMDTSIEIFLKDARTLDPEAQVGDELGEKIDSHQFGRIAAQSAKQVIIQKLREAENNIIYTEYKNRVGEIITGIVRRFERGNIIVDLGRTEALIPKSEQVPTEIYKTGERIQAYFLELRQDARGPQLILSRRTPNLIRSLFAMEVPEINEGIVEIKCVAREIGNRAKVAVYSQDSDVDPVGACVGMKGSRVQSVVQELRGEKIDIVCWEEDPARFVVNAIAPAEVAKVVIHEKEHSMEIIVPDDQLSLAIGKRGQNVRLAAQITGWNIDIFNESKHEKITVRSKRALALDLEIEDSLASIFYSHGFRSAKIVVATPVENFLTLPGINQDSLKVIYERASHVMRMSEEERPSSIYMHEETLKDQQEAEAAKAAAKAASELKIQAELAEATGGESPDASAVETAETSTVGDPSQDEGAEGTS